MEPKVFFSYSWTSPVHQELVRSWADRLLADGVEVILDIYDLKEGADKNAFMEKMVTDPTVTHVLVVCESGYRKKANERRAGVGTESQIISQEVYEKVAQSKFIPIVCEFDDSGNPVLPAFLKSRIYVDFSSLEAVNENWEQLIRHLYGRPQHAKPKRGRSPSYITSDDPLPVSGITAKLNSLRQAILQEKKGIIEISRRDFLDECVGYANKMRVRDPMVDSVGDKVLETADTLKQVIGPVVDWVLLESRSAEEEAFAEVLIDFLESLRELKSRPVELNGWREGWFDAHVVFVYETFLYIVAALLKTKSYRVLHEVYASRYLRPATDSGGLTELDRFDSFYGHSDVLQSALAPEGRKLHAPAAELVKRHADREDLPFRDIQQAELLTALVSFLTPETYWYPQTLLYWPRYAKFTFFIKAAQRKHFAKLATITGVNDASKMRSIVKQTVQGDGGGMQGLWERYRIDIVSLMNLDNLDTIE